MYVCIYMRGFLASLYPCLGDFIKTTVQMAVAESGPRREHHELGVYMGDRLWKKPATL